MGHEQTRKRIYEMDGLLATIKAIFSVFYKLEMFLSCFLSHLNALTLFLSPITLYPSVSSLFFCTYKDVTDFTRGVSVMMTNSSS